MRVAVLLSSAKGGKQRLLRALGAGIEAAGDEAVYCTALPDPVHRDAAIVYGIPSPHVHPAIRRAREVACALYGHLGRLLCLEAGLLPRAGEPEGPRWWHAAETYSLTRLGEDGWRTLLPADLVDRWIALGYQHGGFWKFWHYGQIQRVLLCGITRADLETYGFDSVIWHSNIAGALLRQGYAVTFRQHPRGGFEVLAVPVTCSIEEDLNAEIAAHDLVVTAGGTPALHAAIMGKPVVTLHPDATAWPVAGHSVEPLEIVRPPREDWFRALGYAQWRVDELADGTAWRHARERLG